jgi:hypothetical protein
MGLLAQRQDYDTGRLVKQDPLPTGRYWIDILTLGEPVWQSWLVAAGSAVVVLKTEHFDAIEPWPIPTPNNPGMVSAPAHTWYLFQVNTSVHWGIEPAVGWPNHASASVQNSNDTSTADQATDAANEADADKWRWLKYAVFGAIAVGGIWGVAKLVRG